MMNFTKQQSDMVRLASYIFETYLNVGVISWSQLFEDAENGLPDVDRPLLYDDFVTPMEEEGTYSYPLIAGIDADEDNEPYITYLHDMYDEYDILCVVTLNKDDEIIYFAIHDEDQSIYIDESGIYIVPLEDEDEE